MSANIALGRAIIRLLNKKRFYAELLLRVERIYTDKIPTAGVTIKDKILLYVNPDFFLSLNHDQQEDLLEHEMRHIMNHHMLRFKKMSKEGHKGNLHSNQNLAADAAINGDLTSLHEMGITPKKLSEYMRSKDPKFPELEEDKSAEYYYAAIKDFLDKNPDAGTPNGPGTEVDDHSMWEECDESIAKDVVKKAANEAFKAAGGIGNVSNDISSLINELNKPLINWKNQLNQFIIKSNAYLKEPTRKRINRRYGIIYSGKRKKPDFNLAICVDTSGSVSDKQLTQFFSEIEKISDYCSTITIIEADCVVQNVYEYKKGSTFSPKGRGGTNYGVPLAHAKSLGVDAVVFMGDGDCADIPEDPKIPVLWCFVGSNTNKPGDFGKLITIPMEERY